MGEPDFDELSRNANAPGAAIEELDKLFGAAFDLKEWQFVARGEVPDLHPYIASNAATAEGRQMVRAFTDGARLQRFAQENGLTDAAGNALVLGIPTTGIVEYLEQFIAHGVYGVWFNSDTQSDGFFVPLAQLRPIRDHLQLIRKGLSNDQIQAQDNLANFGMSKTSDGDMDTRSVLNKVGVVRYEPRIDSLRAAIAPSLADYIGTGDFVTLLAFDPVGISSLSENIIRNDHGPYLRCRNFRYVNPKNGVHIAVLSIHSNHLRHVRSAAELIVSIELCKNLANLTTVLYHRFEGPRADVLRLSDAIAPILEQSQYDPVS